MTPEELARQEIDRWLARCGWAVQSRNEMNTLAAERVATREFPMLTAETDYLLYASGKASASSRPSRRGTPWRTSKAKELDLVGLTLSEADPDEFDTPEERREFERWLDSLDGRIEERERRDAFLGHGS